jgi:hypothetical protein
MTNLEMPMVSPRGSNPAENAASITRGARHCAASGAAAGAGPRVRRTVTGPELRHRPAAAMRWPGFPD